MSGQFAEPDKWQRPPSVIHRGWRYTIHLGRRIEAGDDFTFDTAPIPAGLQATVCAALKASPDWGDELSEIAEAFSSAGNVGEFDEALTDLYDWGDRNRVIVAWTPG